MSLSDSIVKQTNSILEMVEAQKGTLQETHNALNTAPNITPKIKDLHEELKTAMTQSMSKNKKVAAKGHKRILEIKAEVTSIIANHKK